MIKRMALPSGVLARLPEAGRYLARNRRVEFAYLFGGLARHGPTATSDIDIAVYLTEKADPARDRLGLLGSSRPILFSPGTG